MSSITRADIADALSAGFEAGTAEKVARLLEVLKELQADGDTRDEFTLKGGTALNVFHQPRVPRLSVDIDLMVTGPREGESADATRLSAVRSLKRIATHLGYRTTLSPAAAGTSLYLRYQNLAGGPDQIKIDADFMNRITLRPAVSKTGPRVFLGEDVEFQVVGESELLAQKLVAVAYRAHERDLFDMHMMLDLKWHLMPQARKLYLIYSYFHDSSWRRLGYPAKLEVPYDPDGLRELLRSGESPPSLPEIRERAKEDLGTAVPSFFQYSKEEDAMRRDLLAGDFTQLPRFLQEGDSVRNQRLSNHPSLLWRARNPSDE